MPPGCRVSSSRSRSMRRCWVNLPVGRPTRAIEGDVYHASPLLDDVPRQNLAALGEVERGLDAKIGARGAAFGLKQVELVDLVQREPEVIDEDRPGQGRVEPAQVDGQLTVDEDPDVIVPAEGE